MIHLLMLTARHSAFFHLHLFPHAVSFDRFLGRDIEGLLCEATRPEPLYQYSCAIAWFWRVIDPLE